MVRIVRYCQELHQDWNDFIQTSKNGFFLFDRDYMEYHSDRFVDHSLLFFKNDELLAVLPANETNGIFYSHGGLTYGGFITNKRTSVVFILEAFDVLILYLKEKGFSSFIYKIVPFIYHCLPAQEDLYALFRINASLCRRDASSVIDLSQMPLYTKGTKSNLSKARKAGLLVKESSNFSVFFDIAIEILKTKYNTKPTHTAQEMSLLASRFPENIKLYFIYKEDLCLGGTIAFITELVFHTQYIAISDLGKETGALDFLTDYLI
ncbi:MAG TPA: hypothetical protein VNS32_11620, partial [Flavisolibacter sp.]|nr:hypothetical protein [Flavisolibacter sp.]